MNTLPLSSPNRSTERPLHANETTPKLPGLTDHGKKLEQELEDRVRKGDLHPTHVGSERVSRTHYLRSRAEQERNLHHTYGLHLKKEIRKGNRTWTGRKLLQLKQTEAKLQETRNDKNKSKQILNKIAHDSNIHKKINTFGDKDVKHISKPVWKKSKELGYSSDDRSKGSSYGYRSRSTSPESRDPHDTFLRRPSRPSPSHSQKSESVSSGLPSLSSSHYTSPSTSRASSSQSPSSPQGSTASSRLRSH